MNPLQVADSFLVANGKVRGIELHRQRFISSCTALGVAADEFWDESVGRLPGFGRWFPRFELTADGELAVRLRPAPPTGGRIRIAVHEGPDPRTNPRVKGPDLESLGELKAGAAATYGADEVLLTGTDGIALEAAYSGLVWWEDDLLCVPPADRPVLPSVTVRLIRQLAAARGIEVVERARTAADLTDYEVWLVNALHGIRPVDAWHSTPIDPLPGTPSTAWQQSLASLARPL